MNTISVIKELTVIKNKKMDALLPIIEYGDCSGYVSPEKTQEYVDVWSKQWH